MKNIGSVIKRYRNEAGISQGQLAKKVGVVRGYISDLECGRKNNPTYDVIGLIANALSIPAGLLMNEKTKGTTVQFPLHIHMRLDEAALKHNTTKVAIAIAGIEHEIARLDSLHKTG